MTTKREDLIEWYEDAVDDYGEALQNTVQHFLAREVWRQFLGRIS